MGYLAHTLVAFGGPLTSQAVQDEWQCGVRLRLLQPDGISQGNGVTDPAAYMAAIEAPLLAWFGTVNSTTSGSEFNAMRADAWLSWVKVNNITAGAVGPGQPGGKYADPTTHVFDYPTPQAGRSVATAQPPFVTAAVSFTTALSRGPGHRGRVFLPFGLTLTNTGRLQSTQQIGCNRAAAALLTLLKAPTDANGTIVPIIASKINGSRAAINGVETGDVFDVQRRRKDDLIEAYVHQSWP
jgi:hypothetical protein